MYAQGAQQYFTPSLMRPSPKIVRPHVGHVIFAIEIPPLPALLPWPIVYYQCYGFQAYFHVTWVTLARRHVAADLSGRLLSLGGTKILEDVVKSRVGNLKSSLRGGLNNDY